MQRLYIFMQDIYHHMWLVVVLSYNISCVVVVYNVAVFFSFIRSVIKKIESIQSHGKHLQRVASRAASIAAAKERDLAMLTSLQAPFKYRDVVKDGNLTARYDLVKHMRRKLADQNFQLSTVLDRLQFLQYRFKRLMEEVHRTSNAFGPKNQLFRFQFAQHFQQL